MEKFGAGGRIGKGPFFVDISFKGFVRKTVKRGTGTSVRFVSLCLSAWNDQSVLERILVKFVLCGIFLK